jgi:hypothetical protein
MFHVFTVGWFQGKHAGTFDTERYIWACEADTGLGTDGRAVSLVSQCNVLCTIQIERAIPRLSKNQTKNTENLQEYSAGEKKPPKWCKSKPVADANIILLPLVRTGRCRRQAIHPC